MVTDGYQVTLDLDQWNSVNPDQEPISLPMDMTLDIEIRKPRTKARTRTTRPNVSSSGSLPPPAQARRAGLA